jgi:hypothetical protein
MQIHDLRISLFSDRDKDMDNYNDNKNDNDNYHEKNFIKKEFPLKMGEFQIELKNSYNLNCKKNKFFFKLNINKY